MSLNRYHRKSLERALNNQLRRLNNKKSKVGRWSERISLWRLIVFIGGLTAIYMAARVGNPWLTGLVTAASVGGFGTLVSWHRRLDKILEKFSGWSEIRTAHLARMQLNWEGIPEYPPEHENREHPFGRDLNITGPHSLMHLIDISIYRGGSENLKNWLLATEPDIERTKQNQLLVEELKPLAHFRDRLMLRAKLTQARQSEKDWDMDTLQRWLKQNREKSYRKSLALLWGLSGINILLALLYVFGILNPWFILSFLIYLLVYNYNSGKIKG
ncbi:MAG: hypothetical protein R3211_06165, partial [Balneolaceae bacterium]|nr:hypothetical protein [Balneolaceae bacterium]